MRIALLAFALVLVGGCGNDRTEKPAGIRFGSVIGNAEGWYDGSVGNIGEHGGTIFAVCRDRILMAGIAFPEEHPIADVIAICAGGIVTIAARGKDGTWHTESWRYFDRDGRRVAEWIGSDEGEGPIHELVLPLDRRAFDAWVGDPHAATEPAKARER